MFLGGLVVKDPELWLECTAAVQVRSMVQEFPHAPGMAKKKKNYMRGLLVMDKLFSKNM